MNASDVLLVLYIFLRCDILNENATDGRQGHDKANLSLYMSCRRLLTHPLTHTGKSRGGNSGLNSTSDRILLDQKGPKIVAQQGIYGF